MSDEPVHLCVSDAKTVDYQAGLESGMGALLGALAGINVISGAGMLDFLLTQSLEKLLLDHEACGMALRAARGIQEDGSDSLALISEVVRLGELLSHEHTRRNWRRELAVASRAIDRASYGDWEKAGGARADERAAGEVERILRDPAIPPLAPDISATLDEIMRLERGRIPGAFRG